MPEQRLNDPDVNAALQQVCRKTVPQGVQCDRLGDTRCTRCLLEQPRELTGLKMPAAITGEKHAIRPGDTPVVDGRAFGPPDPQQAQNINGQHHVAVLASLRLHDADNVLFPVDVADLQPDDLACPQPATIGEWQHHARLQAGGHGEDAPDLVEPQHNGNLHGLLEVEHFGRQVMPAQGDTEQKLHPGHGLVAGADTGPALDQMQLEELHIIR